ncbi:50S ribosomal protein L24 [Herbivorax sp. ANBcel31]|uniref:50S ribosomal protein L24 n=1 Tax=Herbivorax sp. ANBcel31 TaxID=3069754 RepID=UPI0027B1940A|nr:50S ribosomal protein L24 [Herbivorax sp. ANBcel31]MDQ2087592.1 50S ribosomal protein L24 [Herbivorax sp. ANBcel31]
MKNKIHVKQGDTVIVLNGKDKDKKGKVIDTMPDRSMIVVEGVNMTKKNVKPRPPRQQGGIVNQESPIHSSKVMLVCSRCGKPSKTKITVYENGSKDRECKKCGETIDSIRGPKK